METIILHFCDTEYYVDIIFAVQFQNKSHDYVPHFNLPRHFE